MITCKDCKHWGQDSEHRGRVSTMDGESTGWGVCGLNMYDYLDGELPPTYESYGCILGESKAVLSMCEHCVEMSETGCNSDGSGCMSCGADKPADSKEPKGNG